MNTTAACLPERILVPDAKFQEAKSDYLGQLIVTPEMVAKKIKAMKDNKSHHILMETVEQICITLARVFNLSLKEGVVPFELHYLKRVR